MMETFETAVLSRRGGRKSNQDHVQHHQLGAAGCWVVADGLGGHQGGEVAAQLATHHLVETYKLQSQCSPETLRRGFYQAHQAIVHRQAEDVRLQDMRTTALALMAGPAGVLWGHMGDTRLYWFREGRRIFQSRDHTVQQALHGANRHHHQLPARTPGRHQLTRSLGQPDADEPEILNAVQPVANGDAFLLCSDGFWEALNPTEMEIDLAKSASPQDWLDRLEERLVDHGGHRGDNYTALAVFCHHPLGQVGSVPLPPDPDASRKQGKRPTKVKRHSLSKALPLLIAGLLVFGVGGVTAWMWTVLQDAFGDSETSSVVAQGDDLASTGTPSDPQLAVGSGEALVQANEVFPHAPHAEEVPETPSQVSAAPAAEAPHRSRVAEGPRPQASRANRGNPAVQANRASAPAPIAPKPTENHPEDVESPASALNGEEPAAVPPSPADALSKVGPDDETPTEVPDLVGIEEDGTATDLSSSSTSHELSSKTGPELFQVLDPEDDGGSEAAEQLGRTWRQETDHQVYVWIPSQDRAPGFWIGQTEVTVGAYRRFVQVYSDMGLEQPDWSQEDHFPIVNIDWSTASNFCVWAGGRLPKHDEWLRAASDGLGVQLYPWGDHHPACKPEARHGVVFGACKFGQPTNVRKFLSSENYGLHHIVGNVEEWGWTQRKRAPTFGGSWKSGRFHLRIDARPPTYSKHKTAEHLGFRCVLEGEPRP